MITMTAIHRPMAASIFLEIAINVHIPKNTERAIFSMNTAFIKILK